jgi:5'-nucleotidase
VRPLDSGCILTFGKEPNIMRFHRRSIAVAVLSLLLLIPSSFAQTPAQTVRVTLLQVNDVYQTTPVDKGKRGGLARIATLKKEIAAQSPNTLLLLAGDTIFPSVASRIFKGAQMIAAWNAVGLDYAALGNHEFDLGPEVALDRIKESRFVWLAANVIDRKTGRPFGGSPRYVVREFDGARIGIFGLLTTDTAVSSKPGNGIGFLDPIRTARRIVAELRARGVKTIIAITHLPMSADKQLARSVPVDVIIGGHEHTLLQSHAGRTPIFKMGSDARNLGRIDLNVDRRSGAVHSIDWEVIPVTDATADDPAAAAVIAEYENKLAAEMDGPVGRTSVVLDARQETNRSEETNLGSFVADAYRSATGAEVALLNGGSIRSNTTYGPGTLTKRNVISILPFENPIVKVEVTGALIRKALEHGVSRIVEDKEEGRFPQVSGLEFSFDGRRAPGSRVVEIKVNGVLIDDKRTYTLATNTYLLGGGDGYNMFGGVRYLISAEEGQVEPAVVMNAISSVDAIAPKTEGRIKRLDQ